jgi:hypothetical protein
LAPFDHLTRDGEPGSATAANAATSVTKGGLHLPSLNGIRTVAFALVFLGHAGLNKIVPAAFGVTLFFFLSGYLITALLRLELEKTGTVSLKNFYLRRMMRILPPFYLDSRITPTTSSSVKSGSSSISASKKSACFSSGDVLPPRGLAAQRPVSRKHFTQITAVLGLTS